MKKKVIIVGAGIAGLSCAITLAGRGFDILLVSNQASERSGSCMAEGGINAALDTYGEGDSVEKHFEDTRNNALKVADEEGIRGLTQAAPDIVRWLQDLGVRFTLTGDGRIDVRYFGGQKLRRTAYAGDSTGKQIMTALIDRARKYEAAGSIQRLSHHSFQRLRVCGKKILGFVLKDDFTEETLELTAPAVVMAVGGYHGIFGNTTGSRADSGEAAAVLFYQGVPMSNPEFIQFHPTTVSNGAKRLLITEAARGEGGRLCTLQKGMPDYFMEKKYPEMKNRMPRDITSREIIRQKSQCYLDLTGLDPAVFEHKLSELRENCLLYLGRDPIRDLIPVSPGIHYFMGGISVDTKHRAGLEGLYAAGECAACYHGANRLGGNSLLGAVYGGRTAAETIAEEYSALEEGSEGLSEDPYTAPPEGAAERSEIAAILNEALGILRNEEDLQTAGQKLKKYTGPVGIFAGASVACALNRRESRGAHYRSDHTAMDPAFDGASIVTYDGKEIRIDIHHFR